MIEQIKQTNDIGRVISRYVTLNRRGDKLVGVCPFHEDHHPSLQVHPGRQNFICYACGAKGDVISFVQQIERCTFKEALKKLSPKAPLNPPKGGTKNNTPSRLPPFGGIEGGPIPVDHTPLLQKLMPYCSGDRELTPFYLDFEVGLAPHLLPAFWKALAGRIIFPIRDKEGKLVGFSGRKTEQAPDHLPKYLNTSSADGYRRNEHLYGLYKAKETIRQSGRVYLTEGAKDTIAMHAAGFNNCVGLCGKELSSRQQQLITELTRCVCLVLDGDAAGREGAARVTSQLAQAGIETVRLCLPEGDDPDSLFRKRGKEGFREYILEQAFPPSPAEKDLIAGCLLLPEATIELEEGCYPFVEILPGLLENDRLPLISSIHREILQMLSEQIPRDRWREELKEIAGQLMKRERSSVRIPGGTSAEPDHGDNQQAGLEMKKRLFCYGEDYLIREIKELLRCLPQQEGENRKKLLQLYMDRQQLLNRISRSLGRCDAI